MWWVIAWAMIGMWWWGYFVALQEKTWSSRVWGFVVGVIWPVWMAFNCYEAWKEFRADSKRGVGNDVS